MGTVNSPGGLASALFGRARRAVLSLLFCHSDRPFYLREITRATGMGQGAVQRELSRLAKAGLVTRRKEGHQVYYRANRQSPVFNEIRALMTKTVAVADVLREALGPVKDHITVAFVYGSVAKGTENADSDVDVMVVGRASFKQVCDVFSSLDGTLGRAVNPSVYSAREFRSKLRAKHHFLTSVVRDPKIFLIGGERDLGKLAQGKLARETPH